MDIMRAYKTKLRVNNRERATLARCADAALAVYNLALQDRIEYYKAGKPTMFYKQTKRFNAVKHELFPWLDGLPYSLTEFAFWNLDAAYKNFFRRCKKGAEQKGFPRFKVAGKCASSFMLRGSIQVERARVRLPVLGWFRLAEKGYLPIDGTEGIRVLFLTVSEKAGEWYVSLQVEQTVFDPEPVTGPALGIDLGIKMLAVCSDGRVFENPRSINKHEWKLKRLDKELARRTKGGQNWKKTKAKIAKLHRKIANVRRHEQHEMSAAVTNGRRPRVIVMENLNVKGMVKNRSLSKAISDAAPGELRRQVGYKAGWTGIEFQLAGRFFPSSKTCSECGAVKAELGLSERVYYCDICGLVIDRDLNAARNLAALAEPVSNGGLPVELGAQLGPAEKQEASSVAEVCHA